MDAALVARSTQDRSAHATLLRWCVPLFVALITFVAFLPALRAGFVSWDDDKNFLANPYYRGLGLAQLGWMWTTFHLGHYVPLTWMTLGLDYLLWGMNPAGYHRTSLVLHSADAVLVYFLARRVIGVEARGVTMVQRRHLAVSSAFAALVFSLHPLRVESVVWVTERRDVLSYLFYLTSALLYMRAVESDDARRRWYWPSVAVFACALLSKATSVTLPAVLLILNAYPLKRIGSASGGWWSQSSRNVYRELVPFIVLAGATVIMTFLALPHQTQLNVAQKAAVSAYSLMFYLWKTVAPTSLAPLYAMPVRIDPAASKYLVSYAVIISLGVAAWLARRKAPVVAMAWLAFLVAVLPMLGVVQNGPQIAADRYTYFAAPFLGVLAGAALLKLLPAFGGVATGVAGAILVALGALTWNQATVWENSRTLWTHVLQVEPDSPIARNNMGNVWFQQGRFDDAIEQYQRSITLKPNYPEAHNNLGVALSRRGKFDDAIAEYQRALVASPLNDEAHDNWGVALAAQGRAVDAIEQYRQAIAINPDNADAQVNWGNALLLLGNIRGAIDQYTVALRMRPDNAEAYVNWGVALARQGKLVEAVEKFRRALLITPDHPEASEYLARSLEILKAQPVGSSR